MLDWFTGGPKVNEEHTVPQGIVEPFLHDHSIFSAYTDAQSNAGDAPDTPAPQFAIRALKSAFLGTPHAKQSARKNQPRANFGERLEDNREDQQLELNEQHLSRLELNQNQKNKPLLSPAKGILLTPGTAANKRKTVSFGEPKKGGTAGVDLFSGQTCEKANEGGSKVKPAKARKLQGDQETQSVLTNLTFESQLGVSKRRVGERTNTKETVDPDVTEGQGLSPNSSCEVLPDTTVDLDIPRSRSGRHWKGEYDQYQRKSNREIKRLIQHGQIIKSYAQRKDSEATGLHEKLNRELAKVASMEAKVSELAMELANARLRAITGEEPKQLVTDLAKQTITAIRSKQKAEKYRAALEAHDGLVASPKEDDDCVHIELNHNPMPLTQQAESQELASLRSDLDQLQSASMVAGDKAIKLENENMALKQTLARIKVEMQSYEQRRYAREERLKRKQNKLLAAKEKAEAKFEQLRLKHEELQCTQHLNVNEEQSRTSSGQQEKKNPAPSEARRKELQHPKRNQNQNHTGKALEGRHFNLASKVDSDVVRERPISTVRRPPSRLNYNPQQSRESELGEDKKSLEPISTAPQASQGTDEDIWTHNVDENLVDDTLPYTESPQNSDFTILRRSTYAALREIFQNSISEQPKSNDPSSPSKLEPLEKSSTPASLLQKPQLSSAVRPLHSRRSNLVSPRPLFLSAAYSGQESEPQQWRSQSSLVGSGWNASLSSTDTRNSTISLRKALPPDRAEAARKRLEAKRGEKKIKGVTE